MQAVEQPKKSKLWALLSGILGIVWGGLIFVAPSYILPNIFSIVIFSIVFPFTAPSEETLQILHQTQMMFIYLVVFIWVMFIVARISHRYYKKDGRNSVLDYKNLFTGSQFRSYCDAAGSRFLYSRINRHQ